MSTYYALSIIFMKPNFSGKKKKKIILEVED